MNHKSANPNPINDSSRCQHRTSARRRCRLRVLDSHAGLCFRHVQLRLQSLEVPNLAPDLVGQLAQFTSAADINKVLSKLLVLLSQNRVSPRRAAVIAYISSLLLRTLPAIEHESDEDDDKTVVVWGIPSPDRSQPAEAGEPVPQTP